MSDDTKPILQMLGVIQQGQVEMRSEIKDQRTEIRNLTAKVERTITAVEVQKVRQEADANELVEHKAEHSDAKKWFMGLWAGAILGVLGLLWKLIEKLVGQ